VTKRYELTQQEVIAAEVYALKLALSMVLHTMLRDHPRREVALAELASGVEQMAQQLPYGDILQERRHTFRAAVTEKAATLIRLSQAIQRHPVQ